MKKMATKFWFLLFAIASVVFAAGLNPPENPATGIWIQQKGEIVEQPSTNATLYYTRYIGSVDRVKSVDYFYDGLGYLRYANKDTVCGSEGSVKGADGIVHHPDGDLIVAGQGSRLYKIKKGATKENCLVNKSNYKTTAISDTNSTPYEKTFWHVMVDPNQKYVWADQMPGTLVRYSLNRTATNNGMDNLGFEIILTPDANDRRKDKRVTTVVWDTSGHAFFTYSDYMGGGCETDADGNACTQAMKDKYRAGSYFGYFTDTTWQPIRSKSDSAKYLGAVGESVVTAMGTKILIDSLEGCHGATFDPYSNTIFVFGGAKIVQIKPEVVNKKMTAKIVATIDLREYFFQETEANLTLPRTTTCKAASTDGIYGYCDGNMPSYKNHFTNPKYVGWRLDQGTVDGHGHLFVASNTGHIIFVDYAANPQRHIDDNVLVHLQWMDNFLDDLAPLDIVDVKRSSANVSGDVSSSSYARLSSRVEYSSSSGYSSSSAKSSSSGKTSSSSGTVPGSSSSVNSSSSGTVPGSSGSVNSSSSGTVPGSSGSVNSSSSGTVPGSSGSVNSSSSGTVPGSSGSVNSSSSGTVPGSSGGTTDSSSDTDYSSAGQPDESSSSGKGDGQQFGDSSSSGGGGSGVLFSSSSNAGGSGGGYNFGTSSGSGYFDPTWKEKENGDAIVDNSVILKPSDKDPGTPGTVVIGGHVYDVTDDPTGTKLDFRNNSGLDSTKVGTVVAIKLDPDKVKEFFGTPTSELTVSTESNLVLVDPNNPNPGTSIKVNGDGSVVIYVTAYEPVKNGEIKITNGTGTSVIIDNINFYSEIPNGVIAVIKDSNFDGTLDYMEILVDTVAKNLSINSVQLIINGEKLKSTSSIALNKARDRIILKNVSDLDLAHIGERDNVIVYYLDNDDKEVYAGNEIPIREYGSNIIKAAHAIIDTTKNAKGEKIGLDSLFIEFNIDLSPIDIVNPTMIIGVKQKKDTQFFGLGQLTKVYLPSKNIMVFVGKNLYLKGIGKDSVSLYPNKTFDKQEYITSDEYDRQVPVTEEYRLPSAKNVEYWDTDYDGVLDQVVVTFNAPLKKSDLERLYMSFPWYSQRGMLIQLQAQPSMLTLDPKNPSRVIWNVVAATKLASNVTSINESLPDATVYTYYSVFGETFVNEEAVGIVDKMAPVVTSVTLNYGKNKDTLLVAFSEPIKKVDGRDFFRYIHGKDTLDLNPSDLTWSADRITATLIIDGSQVTILPGDSLMVVRGSKGVIQDDYGNIIGDDPSPVVIGGLLNHLVEGTTMGTYDDEDEVLRTLSSVNIRYMPSSTTKEDLEDEGALGQLVQLGERFVPQLLDRAQISADGTVDPSVLDSLDPEKVFISFVVNYYDHLGQYVNDTVITVPCNSAKFGGNCLNSDQKVFVNWNFKDHSGRFVGTGVYMVQFKMVVRYEKKKIEEEIKDKWGVRRKKKK